MMPSRWKAKTSPKTQTPRFLRSAAAVLRATHGQLPGSPLNPDAVARPMDVDSGSDYQEASSPLKIEFETPCRLNRSSTRPDELMLHEPSSSNGEVVEQCPLPRDELKTLQNDLDAFYALDVNRLSTEEYRQYILNLRDLEAAGFITTNANGRNLAANWQNLAPARIHNAVDMMRRWNELRTMVQDEEQSDQDLDDIINEDSQSTENFEDTRTTRSDAKSKPTTELQSLISFHARYLMQSTQSGSELRSAASLLHAGLKVLEYDDATGRVIVNFHISRIRQLIAVGGDDGLEDAFQPLEACINLRLSTCT